MFYSTGILRYSTNPYKLIVEVDTEISNYYRSLIPKYLHVKKQLWQPHISVIRHEVPVNLKFWNKYEGLPLTFEYENFIFNDELYYWLNTYTKELEEVREELGLSGVPSWSNKFHITLGNLKNSSSP